MESQRLKHISKQLSLVLRHRPELIDIHPDQGGWVGVDDLLRQFSAHFQPITQEELMEVVLGNDKKRFAVSEDGQRIRASQGHSITIDLGYAPQKPPPHLYHGTVAVNLPSILLEGLQKGQRHHVHLSPTPEVATQVARRKGAPVILLVEAGRMSNEGHLFFLSDNGVWLSEWVPPTYLRVM